ncbi:hypothetical protein MtrunA17_Chr3g0080671 [Medicago truncatula]|uniref:Transmembrane protein n=1 Tax=Medicago truncatula TaxID=3880 RepID=A0A396IJY5_MEDTR|nr:hypothetical protein MtrunA17_Chr3g0080671 [Medicago truncatula]
MQLWWIQSLDGWWFISFTMKGGTLSSLLLVRDRCASGVCVWFLWISSGVVGVRHGGLKVVQMVALYRCSWWCFWWLVVVFVGLVMMLCCLGDVQVVKVSALVVCELRGALMICVESLVGRSLLILDREPVF